MDEFVIEKYTEIIKGISIMYQFSFLQRTEKYVRVFGFHSELLSKNLSSEI